jgi:hypothetical protein
MHGIRCTVAARRSRRCSPMQGRMAARFSLTIRLELYGLRISIWAIRHRATPLGRSSPQPSHGEPGLVLTAARDNRLAGGAMRPRIDEFYSTFSLFFCF